MTRPAIESLIYDVLAVLPDDVKLDSVGLHFRTVDDFRQIAVLLSVDAVNNAQVNIGVAHALDAVEKLRAFKGE